MPRRKTRDTAALVRHTTEAVQHAFATVLWVVCIGGIVIALVALAMSSATWKDYGRDHLLMESRDLRAPIRTGAAADLERDLEIRQMLEARNHRRARKGQPPIDIEAELVRLTGPKIDEGLRQEIRDLVVARNHRRTRKGQPVLDVEAEIEREIAGLQEL